LGGLNIEEKTISCLLGPNIHQATKMLIHVDQATLFPFWLCLCLWLREAGEEARVSTEKKILEELEKQPIMKHGEHERGSF